MKKQRGALLIGAIVLLLVIGFAAAEIASLSATTSRSSSRMAAVSSANDFAYAGVELGLSALYHGDDNGGVLCENIASATVAGFNLNNITIGNDSIAVTGTLFRTATQLSAAIDNTVTTIPVTDTTGFADVGSLMIDREYVRYSSMTATEFLQTMRGVESSSAIGHIIGTPVAQNQCVITATATIAMPDEDVMSIASAQVRLPVAWLVGNGGNFRQWDGVDIAIVNDDGSVPSQNLNDLSLWSYVDAWAVGNNANGYINIDHWNGVSWVRATTGNGLLDASAAAINEDLYGISCVIGTGCFAVGQNGSILVYFAGTGWQHNPALIDSSVPDNRILRAVSCANTGFCMAVGQHTTGGSGYANVNVWNGTIWSRVAEVNLIGVAQTQLWGVHCIASNDCWAVGDANNPPGPGGTILNINHWNGVNLTRDLTAPSINQRLNSIFCNATNDCWAVGDSGYLVSYNGSAWTASQPAALSALGNLFDVYCNSSTDCWIAGQNGAGHWNGLAWAEVTTPNNTALRGVSSIPMSARPYYFQLGGS